MKDLSVFIDESGDFGGYEEHCPFYLFTLLFHNQVDDITQQVAQLNVRANELGLEGEKCFHAGPIIRREFPFNNMDVVERRRCLNAITLFAKKVKVRYKTFFIDKKFVKNPIDLISKLSIQLRDFIASNKSYFDSFNKIIIYYDNGQVELGRILATAFNMMLANVEFRMVKPYKYKLFQVADLLCTMELVNKKYDLKIQSKSEKTFFGSDRDFKKNYIKPLKKLIFTQK